MRSLEHPKLPFLYPYPWQRFPVFQSDNCYLQIANRSGWAHALEVAKTKTARVLGKPSSLFEKHLFSTQCCVFLSPCSFLYHPRLRPCLRRVSRLLRRC
ncbi:hypothetical protein SERLADRAFT_463685 [Serpula lacrymans var. lacrymans S7.9]|uniref:Uncharacterized protein n=1 Tax=Serpula lacrymans var. lacrymans (strain S7.9) TaxID=578457 RepID=F8NQ42_SERL9|nr:uncharacterized protein SERLADRAFT_463685 [Serpula lacrymans var. lacrymans S7.9]EGO26521.1 hypothetical protein SERLADRAFT_463685 [Serpula lacrymans var. lacrymans S7.9]